MGRLLTWFFTVDGGQWHTGTIGGGKWEYPDFLLSGQEVDGVEGKKKQKSKL